MQRHYFIIAMLATSASPVSAGDRRVGVRSVELITMGEPSQEGDEQPRQTWVLDQMRGAIDDYRVSQPTDPAVLGPGILAVTPGASSIQVPDWMRRTTTFASISASPECGEASYRPSMLLRRESEDRRRALYGLMSRVACEFGVPVGLFDALIIRESAYDPLALSTKLAFGLTQLMAGTARELGVDRGDIEGNLRGGASYLRRQIDRFGQYHLALAAYNAGPGRIREHMVPNIPETRSYVDAVLGNWLKLSAFNQGTAIRNSKFSPAIRRTTATFARVAAVTPF